jgi:hypothetical protein
MLNENIKEYYKRKLFEDIEISSILNSPEYAEVISRFGSIEEAVKQFKLETGVNLFESVERYENNAATLAGWWQRFVDWLTRRGGVQAVKNIPKGYADDPNVWERIQRFLLRHRVPKQGSGIYRDWLFDTAKPYKYGGGIVKEAGSGRWYYYRPTKNGYELWQLPENWQDGNPLPQYIVDEFAMMSDPDFSQQYTADFARQSDYDYDDQMINMDQQYAGRMNPEEEVPSFNPNRG